MNVEIVDGNLTSFSDMLMKALGEMENRILNKVVDATSIILDRIDSILRNGWTRDVINPGSQTNTPSSLSQQNETCI